MQWHDIHGYRQWIQSCRPSGDLDHQAVPDEVSRWPLRPLVSIVMPTYNSPSLWLRRAIESVRQQTYPHWELCIADDASPQPHVRVILEEYRDSDPRIKINLRHINGHISEASNSALALVTGDFVALLDHDDELAPHALYKVAQAIKDRPDLNLIYSDEDKIDERGRRFGPYFKPDWNPELLRAQNVISHLGVYRTERLRAIGGFRVGLEGSQDWDVALRITEHLPAETIAHIPDVLYHWRAISGSTALGHEQKSYVAQSSLRVVDEHLHRTHVQATVEPAFSSYVRVRYALPPTPPLVSLIVLAGSDNASELQTRTAYPQLEIVAYQLTEEASRAKSLNTAALSARGTLLCFLDATLVPHSNEWLNELTAHALRPEIGAVGPMQLDCHGRVHGALTVLTNQLRSDGLAWSAFQGLTTAQHGMAGRAALPQNVSILAPGCLIVRKDVFCQTGMFDAKHYPTLFEFDFCLRLLQSGLRNLWTPYATLQLARPFQRQKVHTEKSETARFRQHWQSFLDHDPAYNPNLCCGSESAFVMGNPSL